MTKKDQAPAHLRPSSKALWNHVTATYELEPYHIPLLTLALEALDRGAEAREQLAASSLILTDDRQNLRPNPLVAIERDARIAYARLMRELGLDASGASNTPRPPALRYARGG